MDPLGRENMMVRLRRLPMLAKTRSLEVRRKMRNKFNEFPLNNVVSM